MRFLSVIAAALFLLSGCGENAAPPDSEKTDANARNHQSTEEPEKGLISFGGLSIGDSEDDMLNKLGPSDRTSDITPNGEDVRYHVYSNGTIWLKNSRIVQIDIRSDSFKTNAGIRLGDTRENAMIAYRDTDHAIVNLHNLMVKTEKEIMIIAFEGGTVSEITSLDLDYHRKAPVDPFAEAEQVKGTPFNINGFGSCGNLNLYRYVKEFFDPAVKVVSENDASTIAACSGEAPSGQSGQIDAAEEEAAVPPAGGFEGKWCDSLQALCFELELNDTNGGTLDYYQERESLKESFDIANVDEYSMDITIDGSKQASLALSMDKTTLTYESDSMKETLTRQ